MQLRLRPGTAEDVEAFCETFFSAFSDNSFTSRMLPRDSPAAWALMRSGFVEEMRDPNAHFVVVEEVSAASPACLVGFAKWLRLADGTPTDASVPGVSEWPQDGEPERAARFFAELSRRHEEIMGRRPHWFLELVATKNEFKGKGAGRLLVEWGLERADLDGWESYLDSTPKAMSLYERHGFRSVLELKFPDAKGEYLHYFMRRDARKQ